MFSPQFRSSLGLLVLRVGAAGIFMSHGALKILSLGASGWTEPAALPPWLQAVVAWTEFAGGALLLLGLLTRVAALALAITQVGAISLVTWQKGLIDLSLNPSSGPANVVYTQVGWEYNLALIAVVLALAILGGGMIAADYCLFRWRQAAAPEAVEPALAPVPAAT